MSIYTEKKRFCEKDTDHIIKGEFEKVFGFPYHTAGGQELFGSKIPDGWYVFNFEDRKDLMIIEDKKDHTLKGNGKIQLKTYYSLIKNKKQFKNIYLVLGLGTYSDFNYIIYKVEDHKMKQTKLKFEDLDQPTKQPFDVKIVHEFHERMYKKGINLPKTQKILFVSAILLTLKVEPNFIKKYNMNTKGFIIAKEMIDIINGYYKDPNLTKSFEFIMIIDKIDTLYELFTILDTDLKSFNGDILKLFYNEFLKYSCDSEGKVGVVLTPDDIVELMVKELNIKNGESLMDCCTGTGSFLLKAYRLYKDLKLIGCENEYIRYSLVKINFILNNIDYSDLYYNDCFKQTFPMTDHIILNPPFSTNQSSEDEKTNHNSERKFCLYQLDFLKEGGTGCWIFPRSNFNNSMKKFNDFKKEILENCQVLKIINCNPNLFGTKAKSECAIIVFKKCKKDEQYETEIIDYSDDGYGYEDGIRIKKKEGSIKSYKEILKYNSNWNFTPFKYADFYTNVKGMFFDRKQYEYLKKFKKLRNNDCYSDIVDIMKQQIEDTEYIEKIKVKEWKKLKITDYFEIVKIESKKIFTITETEDGDIPLISSSKLNKGISKYINDFSVDIQEDFLTIAKNGSVGYCFVRNGKVAVTTDVLILKLKENKKSEFEDLHYLSLIFTDYFSKNYNYSNKVNLTVLKNTTLNYPIIENELEVMKKLKLL